MDYGYFGLGIELAGGEAAPINVPLPEPGQRPEKPRRMKGKWDEGSVEQDLPIIEDTKKVLEGYKHTTMTDKSVSLKKNIKRELETLGWIYQRGATFTANRTLHRKYMIFDFAFIKEGAQDIHRVKVVTDDNGVSDYKLMKWLPKYEI